MRSARARRPLRPLVLGLLLFAAAASAQHSGEIGNAPPPPPGDGALTVQVIHAESPQDVGGLPIALYALGPDASERYPDQWTEQAKEVKDDADEPATAEDGTRAETASSIVPRSTGERFWVRTL